MCVCVVGGWVNANDFASYNGTLASLACVT